MRSSPGTSLVVVGRIPREPSHFVERAELARMDRALERPASVVVVTGLRGVGKTHLAAAHARRLSDSEYGLVGWVNAETPDSTLSGLADIAQRLGVGDPQGDSAESARRLRDHLSGSADPGLLVFDNATDPDRIRDLLPTAGRARVLVTSVDRSFDALGEVVDLACFTRPESVRYLTDSTDLDDDGGADQIAGELGDLPLALSAAAATIAGRRLDYTEYFRLLHESTLPAALQRRAGHDYPRSVVQAILLCIDTIEAATDDYGLDVDVAWLLGVMAMLSPGGVMRSLFAVSERRIDEAVERCVTGSLLSWSVSGDALIMHRLVGRVLRERGRKNLPTGILRRAVRIHRGQGPAPRTAQQLVRSALALILANMFPPSQAWARRVEGAHLVDHIDALWESEMADISTRRHAVALLNVRRWAVEQLIEAADTARALTLAQDVVRSGERLLGPAHSDTYLTRSMLAQAYLAAGQLTAAVWTAETSLSGAVQSLGPADSVTVVLRDQLAGTLHTAGRLPEAAALYTENIAHGVRGFGPGSRSTLGSRCGLAQVHRSAGRLDDAIASFEELVPAYVRELGPDHVETFLCLHHLAHCYGMAGRIDAAVRLLRENLDTALRLFGNDHPLTLACRNNLAELYQTTGRAGEAVRLGEANLIERLRVLGADHPDTLSTRHNLAYALQRAGRLGEAIVLYERNLADFRRVLGSDHPHTLLTQAGLGEAYSAVGRRDEAVVMQEATLRDRFRLLGPEHPQTLHARNNLADALGTQNIARAVPLFEENFATGARLLGPDHPDALMYRHNLASAYLAVGRVDEAHAHLEANLADRLRILGSNNPVTLLSRDNLAHADRAAGRLDSAIGLLAESLAEYHRVLPESPRLRVVRNALADTLGAAGRFADAIPLYEMNVGAYRRELGPDHLDTVRTVDSLARTYLMVGRRREAVGLLETVHERVIRAVGADHPLALSVCENLHEARRADALDAAPSDPDPDP